MASIITTAGEQFIPAAVSGSAPLTNYRIADQIIFANVAGLDHTATPSPDEQIPATVVHTEDISSFSSTNDNNAIFTALLDSSTGDFEFNWLGLYNSEYDVLIQVAYEPPQQKYATDGSAIGNVLAKGMVLKIENAAASFDMTQPAQSWQVDFTGRQKAAEDIQRAAMRGVYGSGSFVNAAGTVIKGGGVYQVEPGAAMIDGLKVEIPATDTTIDINAAAGEYPFYIYATVAQLVSVASVENTVEIETSQTELENYTDQYGQLHARVLIATLEDENTITDQRENVLEALTIAQASIKATTSVYGLTMLDNGFEALNRSGIKAQTADSIQAMVATETERGLVRKATKDEAINKSTSVVTSAERVHDIVENRSGTVIQGLTVNSSSADLDYFTGGYPGDGSYIFSCGQSGYGSFNLVAYIGGNCSWSSGVREKLGRLYKVDIDDSSRNIVSVSGKKLSDGTVTTEAITIYSVVKIV